MNEQIDSLLSRTGNLLNDYKALIQELENNRAILKQVEQAQDKLKEESVSLGKRMDVVENREQQLEHQSVQIRAQEEGLRARELKVIKMEEVKNRLVSDLEERKRQHDEREQQITKKEYLLNDRETKLVTLEQEREAIKVAWEQIEKEKAIDRERKLVLDARESNLEQEKQRIQRYIDA